MLSIPVLAAAAGRFAVTSPAISNGASSTPDAAHVADAPHRRAEMASASGYRLDGSVLGGSDEIFANGFDFNAAYDMAFPFDVPLGADEVTLASIAVPAGTYVAFARLQGQTGTDPNPGNNYRFDCTLLPSFDFPVYRVGEEPNVERYLTYQGAATLPSAGLIGFACRSANGHEAIALSGKLTVISVGGVN
jgi:hypothetical protein